MDIYRRLSLKKNIWAKNDRKFWFIKYQLLINLETKHLINNNKRILIKTLHKPT